MKDYADPLKGYVEIDWSSGKYLGFHPDHELQIQFHIALMLKNGRIKQCPVVLEVSDPELRESVRKSLVKGQRVYFKLMRRGESLSTQTLVGFLPTDTLNFPAVASGSHEDDEAYADVLAAALKIGIAEVVRTSSDGSRFASTFAERYAERFDGTFYVSARSLDKLYEDYRAIGVSLGETDLADMVQQSVNKTLDWFRDNSGWLLIVDDVHISPQILIENLPLSKMGCVLIISASPLGIADMVPLL
jgi:hypothetical protein